VPRSSLLARCAILVAAAAVAAAFLTDFCHLVYRCGCTSPWTGGAEHCNIQQAGPPDCPWCSYGWWGLIVPLGAIVAVQAAVALPSWRLGIALRLVVALLAFPLVGGIVAVAFGLVSGYWRSGAP
jgi:hypothetical protein